MVKPNIPAGGAIKTRKAHQVLLQVLEVDGCRLNEDPVITVWAYWRARVMWMKAIANGVSVSAITSQHDRGCLLRSFTKHEVALHRYGKPNPAWKKMIRPGQRLPPTRVAPAKKHGRPHEYQMDQANAWLLRHYPVLQDKPLHFAMLEALFNLDRDEAIRFPTPDDIEGKDQSWAEQHRQSVRDRARRRIKMALALVNTK